MRRHGYRLPKAPAMTAVHKGARPASSQKAKYTSDGCSTSCPKRDTALRSPGMAGGAVRKDFPSQDPVRSPPTSASVIAIVLLSKINIARTMTTAQIRLMQPREKEWHHRGLHKKNEKAQKSQCIAAHSFSPA